MREIVKVMRFDFLTAAPAARIAFGFTAVMCTLLCMFFSPIIVVYAVMGGMIFVIPLTGVADKSGFNKLYGILPVKRKNITRARLLYVYMIHFVIQLYSFGAAYLSMALKLYRVLPNQESETMQMVKQSFEDAPLTCNTILGISMGLCLIFAYVEMMAQIHGRENELKIILISLAVVTAVPMAFFTLSDKGIIPTIDLSVISRIFRGSLKRVVLVDLIVLGICLLFGEITANKLAKREL